MNREFIPFHKPHISQIEIDEIVDTVKSGWWTTGPKTQKFEQEFKNYLKCDYNAVINSWTGAAHLALEAIGLKKGDEVIVPAMTFTATAEIVCYFGATPVIVDVEKDTFNISISEIEKSITEKTKAIIPVHYGGQPADLDEIYTLAKKYKLRIIEDAAHSLPAEYKGKRIGSFGDIVCFSFYATKTLATGEGGMLCSSDKSIIERAKIMSLHGIDKDSWKRYSNEGNWYYEVISPGFKYNFTDLQASLGLAQLKKVDFLRAERKSIYKKYLEGFSNNELIYEYNLKPDRESSYHLFPLMIEYDKLKINRNDMIESLKELGIGSSVHFIPLYKHPYYKETFNLNSDNYKNCEWIYPRLITLPMWPGLKDEQINYIINSVNNLIRKNKK